MSAELWRGKAARQPLVMRLSVPSDFDTEDREAIWEALREMFRDMARREGFDVALCWGDDTEASE